MDCAISVEDLRRKLKDWEEAFKAIHDRKPKKADVNEAPGEIKNYYRLYAKKRCGHNDIFESISPTTSSFINKGSLRLRRDAFDFQLTTRKITYSQTYFDDEEPNRPCNNPVAGKSRDTSIGCNDVIDQPCCSKSVAVKSWDFSNENSSKINSGGLISNKSRVFHANDIDEAINKGIGLVDEVDFGKRRNLCKFITTNDNADDVIDSSDDSSLKERTKIYDDKSRDIENADDETIEDIVEPENGNLIELDQLNDGKLKKRTVKRRNNENFVKLNLKRRKYAPVGVKKLKGAALKRFLFRMRCKKHRKFS